MAWGAITRGTITRGTVPWGAVGCAVTRTSVRDTVAGSAILLPLGGIAVSTIIAAVLLPGCRRVTVRGGSVVSSRRRGGRVAGEVPLGAAGGLLDEVPALGVVVVLGGPAWREGRVALARGRGLVALLRGWMRRVVFGVWVGGSVVLTTTRVVRRQDSRRRV